VAHQDAVVDLVFTPDKKTLVTADKSGEIKIWDLEKRQAVKTLPKQPQRVATFSMSPDGKTFATASMDNVIRLWDTAEGKELRSWDLKVPMQPTMPFVRALAFTPDGKNIVSANGNTTVYMLECP